MLARQYHQNENQSKNGLQIVRVIEQMGTYRALYSCIEVASVDAL
jgi:hypothetical protein